MASSAPRELRKPDFPGIVYSYTDVLRLLRDQPHGDAGHLAGLTGRVPSNVRRDMRKLIDAQVVEHDGACWLLTDRGRQWVAGQDVAEGLTSAEDAIDRWPIDKCVPNPANRTVNPSSIPDMADQIEGAGDILQRLTLTPVRADGTRMILIGERRWRGASLLRDEGRLPTALVEGLPFDEREATEGEAALIAVIENSGREDMTPWDDALMLARAAKGLGITNGSELARRAGRVREGSRGGMRDVQDKLRLVREATPEQIAAYQANGSWDDFRDKVFKRGAYALHPEPSKPTPLEQAIEDAPETDQSLAWLADQKRRLWPFLDALTPKQLLVLVEVGDLIARTNLKTSRYEAACGDSYPDATKCARHLVENAGLGFTHFQGNHTVTLADATWDWLIEKGLIRELAGADDHRLGLLRQEALGIGAEAKLRQSGRYWAEWLNLDPATQETAKPVPTGPHVVNGVDYGNATRAQEARYAAGILQRPAANYGSSRSETPAPSAEPGAEATLPATTIELLPATAREELAEQRLERLGAALQVLTDRLEPLLAILRGDRTEDGLITIETDDADYYEREVSEACAWAEDALAETTTVFEGQGEEIARSDIGAPAVPIRKSITADFIVCLEDGRKFKSLKRHLRTRYNLSPEEYRRRWGLPADYPMVAPNYAKAREDLARQMGVSRAGAR
jgi:predicted transcriptional regulator